MERLFIGLKVVPGAEIRNLIALFKKRLWRDDIRWVNERNFHLTLKFIGNTTPEVMSSLIKELSEKLDRQKSITLDIKGAGLFGAYTKPKIIWAGAENTNALKELWGKVELSALSAGFEKEERPFHPHITLGRITKTQGPDRLKSIVEEYKNKFLQTQEINKVVLYRSTHPKGELFYEPVKKFKLY
jgi:2'-5' RNA ligase